MDLIGHANYLDDEAVDLLASKRDTVFVGPAIAWEVTYLEKCETLGVSRDTVRAQGYEAVSTSSTSTRARSRPNGPARSLSSPTVPSIR